MPLKSEVDLPNFNQPKRPNPNPEAYHSQNTDAISGAIELRTQEVGSSLQRLDSQLAAFERRYAWAAVQRIDQIPLRIEREIAFMLQEREVTRSGFNLHQAIEAVDVPSFELPPAITPVMGALPM